MEYICPKHFQRMGRPQICLLQTTRQEYYQDSDDDDDNVNDDEDNNNVNDDDDDDNCKASGRKMITADINAIIFITGNFTAIVNCVGIGLRIIFGPLRRGGQ